ncbi:MAG: hypothetical protein AABW80_02225 [Nanoarchaeota archaeon]
MNVVYSVLIGLLLFGIMVQMVGAIEDCEISDQYYKYYYDEKIPLGLSTDKFVIKFDKDFSLNEDYLKIPAIADNLDKFSGYSYVGSEYYVVGLKSCLLKDEIVGMVSSLNDLEFVDDAVLYILNSDKSLFLPADREFMVYINNSEELNNLQELNLMNNVSWVKNLSDKVVLLRANKKHFTGSLEMANKYQETGYFNIVEANLLITGSGNSLSEQKFISFEEKTPESFFNSVYFYLILILILFILIVFALKTRKNG